MPKVGLVTGVKSKQGRCGWITRAFSCFIFWGYRHYFLITLSIATFSYFKKRGTNTFWMRQKSENIVEKKFTQRIKTQQVLKLLRRELTFNSTVATRSSFSHLKFTPSMPQLQGRKSSLKKKNQKEMWLKVNNGRERNLQKSNPSHPRKNGGETARVGISTFWSPILLLYMYSCFGWITLSKQYK